MTQLIRLRLDWYHGGYSAVSLTNERAESLNSVRRNMQTELVLTWASLIRPPSVKRQGSDEGKDGASPHCACSRQC